MWIYRHKAGEYEVGYLETRTDESGSYTVFEMIEAFRNKGEARKAVNYLNGGNSEVEASGIVSNKS